MVPIPTALSPIIRLSVRLKSMPAKPNAMAVIQKAGCVLARFAFRCFDSNGATVCVSVQTRSPITWTMMMVMLSGPPRRFAKSTRNWEASSGGNVATAAPISASPTSPLSPSLQSKKVSPSWTGKGPSQSTWTSEFGPSERVITLEGISSVLWPWARISQTRLWSKVSCSTMPSRRR